MRLNRPSLKDQALEVIRQAMVSGEIRPGEIYSVAALSAELGTSTGPVREAMLALSEQGFFEPVRNRGFRVIPLTEHDLDEVHDVRLMLEVPAMGRLAVEQPFTDEDIETIREHAKRCQEAAEEVGDDLTRFLSADREFHLALTAQLGNARLVKIVGQLRD